MFGFFKKNPSKEEELFKSDFVNKYLIPEYMDITLFGKKEKIRVDAKSVGNNAERADADKIKYLCEELPRMTGEIQDKIREFVEHNYTEFLEIFYGEMFDLEDENYAEIKNDYYNHTHNAVNKALSFMTPTSVFFTTSDMAEMVVFPNMDVEYDQSLKVNITFEKEITVEFEIA